MLRTRWLLTKHETLTENDIKKLKEKLASTGLIGIDEPTETEEEAELAKTKSTAKEKTQETKHVEAKEVKPSKEVPQLAKKPETSEDILNALIARLEKIARARFGLDFMRELVTSRKLNFELAYQQYYGETLHAVETGLGIKREEDGKEYLIYDFKALLDNLIKETNAPPIDINPEEIQERFEEIVLTSKKSNIIDRVILGKPFLRYKS